MKGTQLQGADLRGAQLQGAALRSAQLQGADLRGAQLQGVDLEYAHLQGEYLRETQLQGADLGNAHLEGADLRGAQLQGVNFKGADLRYVDLTEARLQGAVLVKARLQGAVLVKAQLQGAVLAGASIGGASFTKTDLSLSNLQELNRELLTQKDYNELQDFLSTNIVDGGRRTEVLKRIETATRQHDTLVEASAHDALCDEELYATFHPAFTLYATTDYALKLTPYQLQIQACFMQSEVTTYEGKLALYLSGLGCGDAYIARSVADYAQQATDEKRTLGPKLAKALLASDCKGGKALEENTKTKLQDIIT